MAGIDAKTLAAAQQYAEQLALGGAGLQEKVESSVNVYLAENPVIEYVNVKNNGATGDGTSDDSVYMSERKNLYFPDGVYALDLDTTREIISNKDSIIGTGKIKYKGFVKESGITEGQFTGEIPINKLQDEIFMSMNAPYDGAIYITSRRNGSIISWLKDDITYTDAIGAIYHNYTIEQELPESFTVVIGKIKQFGYVESLGKWITLCEEEHPDDAKIYTLPWTSTTVSNVSYTFNEQNQMEIPLTKDQLASACLHFWGKKFYFNEVDYGNISPTDVKYSMMCVEIYVKDTDEDITNSFLIETGIDQKYDTSDGNTTQLFYGSPSALTKTMKRFWGHNVCGNIYDSYVKNEDIMYLWNNNTRADYFEDYHKTLYIPQNASGAAADSLKLFEIPITGSSTRINQIMLTARNMGAYGTKMAYLQVLLQFREVSGAFESPSFLYINHAQGDGIDMNGKFSIALNNETGNYEIYVNGLAGTVTNRLVVDVDMIHVTGSRIIYNNELILAEKHHYVNASSYKTSNFSFVTLSEQTNLTVKKTSTIKDAFNSSKNPFSTAYFKDTATNTIYKVNVTNGELVLTAVE